MTAYHGRAPIVRVGMSPAVALVLAFFVALVIGFGVEIACLLPYLNR